MEQRLSTKEDYLKRVNIVIEHINNHLDEDIDLEKLADIEHVAIYHDDPKVTEESKLRTDICLALPKKAAPKGEIGVKTIEGGKYAMFLYTGSYEHLGAVYDTIYGKWLSESGQRLRNYHCFEKYINNPDKTPPEKLKTEIYVPIE